MTSDDAMGLPTRRVSWWLYLVTAAAWMIIAWVVLRFNLRSVHAIAILAGVVILIAAVSELFNMVTATDWKWLHGIMGVLFLITGIVALFHPGNTFVWLSAFIGWYLLFKGIMDIFLAFATKDDNEAWWLLLVVGIFEVLIGFWAAGRFGRSAYILIMYVGVIALSRAITDVVTAFRLRKLQQAEDAVETTLPLMPKAAAGNVQVRPSTS
jgi:uncharacterized membrane protein HdeD (DUF308 family)